MISPQTEETMSTARDNVVTFARSKVGLKAPNPDYLSLVAPGDAPARQLEIAKASDCGLVLLGIEEGVFVIPPRGEYKDGSAFELAYTRAGGNPWVPGGAFVLPTGVIVPADGDGVVYGNAGSSPAHMETVLTSRLSGLRLMLTCVAGGERDSDGNESVVIMTRNFSWGGVHWIDLATSRPIIGIIDADKMAEKYGLIDDVDRDAVTPRTEV